MERSRIELTDADRAAAEELCPAIDDHDTQRAARVTNVAAIIAQHRADRGYILRPADDVDCVNHDLRIRIKRLEAKVREIEPCHDDAQRKAQRKAEAVREFDRILQHLSAVRCEMSSQ